LDLATVPETTRQARVPSQIEYDAIGTFFEKAMIVSFYVVLNKVYLYFYLFISDDDTNSLSGNKYHKD
jgi:hypothetical protein